MIASIYWRKGLQMGLRRTLLEPQPHTLPNSFSLISSSSFSPLHHRFQSTAGKGEEGKEKNEEGVLSEGRGFLEKKMGEMKVELDKQNKRAREAGEEFREVGKRMEETKAEREKIRQLEKEVKAAGGNKKGEPKHWIWVTMFAGVAFYHILYYWRLKGEKNYEDLCEKILKERVDEELEKIKASTPEFLEKNIHVFLSNFGVDVLKSQLTTGKVSFQTIDAEIEKFRGEITENYSQWVVSPELRMEPKPEPEMEDDEEEQEEQEKQKEQEENKQTN